MRLTSIILAAILGVTVAVPVEVAPEQNDIFVRNTAIEQMIIDTIEELRVLMQTGSDDVPVLDPLELDQLDLDLNLLGFPGSHVAAENAEVKYVSTFVLDEVSANLATILPPRYRVIIDAHIPVIEASADKYDLSVDIAGLNIFGNGNAKVRIIEPRVHVNVLANIGLIGGISVSIDSARVNVKLTAFEPELTGMFGDDMLNDFVNAFLANFIPEVLEFYEEEISDILSDLVMEIAGGLLPLSDQMRQQLAVAAILPILESSGGDMPAILEKAGLQ